LVITDYVKSPSSIDRRAAFWFVILKARLLRLKDLNPKNSPRRIRRLRFGLLIADP
jgi:hypothetical protein